MLKLYHGRTSVCSVKARLALAEKERRFESQLLALQGDQYDLEYMKLNPNAVVPTLVDGNRVIIESTVIMHYVNDMSSDPPLMPADPAARSEVHMTCKLMDEYIHNCCTVLTFATVNRASMLSKPKEMEAEFAKAPSRARADAKRQVMQMGLDAPLVVIALQQHKKLLDRIDLAMTRGPYIAGDNYSLADCAATPYIFRLDMLRLSQLWDKRPGVAAWYERIRQRPSFKAAVLNWLTPANIERYKSFEPDPWPKVSAIVQAA